MEVVIAHPAVRKFIGGLGGPANSKTIRLLELLGREGAHLGMPVSRHLSGDIFELRILGTQNIRILYAPHDGRIYLLHAFAKKAQKMAQKDIALAHARLAQLRTI